jgi:adenosylmethionine-8-amino-7-oxononanoate aminotransferase
MGAGGMIVYLPQYLEGLSKLAKKYNVHFILDEIAVGFGRTGKMFAFEYIKNIHFDFLCLSKGLTAGYLPMAATMTTKKIYDSFYDDYDKGKTFFHGHTFTANPLACAAALASLDLFARRGGSRRACRQAGTALDNAQNIGKKLQQYLQGYKGHPYVGDIRGIGLELVKNKITKEEFDPKVRIGYQIYKEGLKYGLILRPLGNVIYFFLPLSTTEKELKDIFKHFQTVMGWFDNFIKI